MENKIQKIEIICEDGKTKIRLNDGEVLKRVTKVEFKHDAGECPELYINNTNLLAGMKKPLSNATTKELAEELSDRLGVEKIIAEPYKNQEVRVNGPATILVIID